MNKLHLSEAAQSDLADIQAYITGELGNPVAAKAVLRRIIKDIRALRDHALIGAPLFSITNVQSDYRFLVTGNYLTFYRVQGGEVYVDRILYGGRNYLRILFGEIAGGKHAE